MTKQYCEHGHKLTGTEDTQTMADGSIEPICPKCLEMEERLENAAISRCAGDYPSSVRFN